MEALRWAADVLFSWKRFHILAAAVIVFEVIACAAAIRFVPYTEIDWKAYMQEVGGFLGGELDYMNLRGGTGPLVYPAGFVWLYSGFYYLTGSDPQGEGADIFLAQCVFAVLYVLTTAVTLAVYAKARPGAPWIVVVLVLSKRLHSIFVLRLFNDGPAALLALAAILAFQHRRWVLGCVLYSLGVSIKMNVLLFAPALLLLLLRNTGGWPGAIFHIGICAAIQGALGAPFLLSFPKSYIVKSFELSRVFNHTWTVNYRFLDEESFVDKRLALALLACHLAFLFFLLVRWFGCSPSRWMRAPEGGDSPRVIALALFAANFVGIVFARSLHAQFWTWYAHSLPLLGAESALGMPLALPLLAGMDFAFGYVWPTTDFSSGLLQVCHVVLLLALLAAPLPVHPGDVAAALGDAPASRTHLRKGKKKQA